MLQKNVFGRLGNQMFQYAALRAYALEYKNEEIVLNFNRVYDENFKNDLKDFNINDYKESNNIKLSLTQKVIIKIFRKYEFILSKKYSDNRLKYNNKINKLEKRVSKILMHFGIY